MFMKSNEAGVSSLCIPAGVVFRPHKSELWPCKGKGRPGMQL